MLYNKFLITLNHLGGVMVFEMASSTVNHEFDPWLGQIKNYKIGFGASLLSKQYKGRMTNTH